MSVCLGAGNCWFLAALQALTFHQDILAAVVPQNQSFERKYAGIFHFRVCWLHWSEGGLQKSPVMFYVKSLDNFYKVSLGQGQAARGYPGLEGSPSLLPQNNAGRGLTSLRICLSLSLLPGWALSNILIKTDVLT